MAHVNSLKYIWEKADSSYIEATKPTGRTPVSRRLFPQVSSEEIKPHLRRDEDEFETASVCSSKCDSLVDFDAIPEEFRPSGKGKGLLKVKASPRKENSLDNDDKKEQPQNENFPNAPNVLLMQRGNKKLNSSTIQNKTRDYNKEFTRTGNSEQAHSAIESKQQKSGGMFLEQTGKQKNSGGMFFYGDTSKDESTSKSSSGCQQMCSSKENSQELPVKDTEVKNNFRSGFYDPESSQSKAKKEFHIEPSNEKHKEETNFNKIKRPEFHKRNANNQNKKGDDFFKHDKNVPYKFQQRSGGIQNKGYRQKDQNVIREVTVENCIKWKNELCEVQKPENKPNFFYQYTKTTKESVCYVPTHGEDGYNDDDGVTKKSYQDFQKGRDLCNNFRRKYIGQYNKQLSENQKSKRFDTSSNDQTNKVKNFAREMTHKPGNKLEEMNNCFQLGNNKDPIIIRHEIKVVHVNQQQRNSGKFYHSSKKFQTYKGRNGKMMNTTERNCDTINSDTPERRFKINNHDNGETIDMINIDSRDRNDRTNIYTKERNCRTKIYCGERNDPTNTYSGEKNGKILNTDPEEYCGVEIEERTTKKTAEGFQRTRKNFVRIPMKLPSPSLKSENKQNIVPRTRDSVNGMALIKYGRDISDMIAGSYVAFSTFLDNYDQWKDFRRVTMLLFEEVERSLSQSSHKNTRIVEVASLVGTGCKMVQFVPHVGVSIAAKVIAVLSDVVSRIFSSSNSAKSIGMDDFQLRLSLQSDMESTSDIYMYGMQCDINFQETCQLIEEFHGEVQNGRFKEFEETFETGFLKQVSLLNPQHPAVFYKKLGRFYELLNEHQQSEEGKAFCGAFEDWPDALTTISRLHRRFQTEKWDSSSVMRAWEEVYNLLQSEQSLVEDVLKKVQDCICVLMREQSIMDRYVRDLQRQC